ncbi:MAG: ferredoxin-NADP reductase, partial [Bacteroidia bacterium]
LIERSVEVLSALFLLELLAIGVFILRGSLRRSRADQVYFEQRQQGLRELLELDLRKRELAMAASEHSWNGFRKFEVAKKESECGDITSFYLKPHDKRPIAAYRPGQYLTFKLNIPDHPKAVVRCYSLSDAPQQEYYRVSIKKAAPPANVPEAPWGLSSSYFHEQVKEGDILDVKVPSGAFFLDVNAGEPVVLAAGGVGVTPMLSMLNALVQVNARQPIWFFYGVKDGSELVQGQQIRALAQRHDNIKVVFCFSRPLVSDEVGKGYHVQGRVSVDLFREKLGSNNFAFYLCGSGPFMQSLTEGLHDWGVPADKINMEAFGPSSLVATKPAASDSSVTPAASFSVKFSRSGKTVQSENNSTVLEIAEANGIDLEYGCRAGNCGTCLVALRGGEVQYDVDHDVEIEFGSCLACIAKPAANIIVDA